MTARKREAVNSKIEENCSETTCSEAKPTKSKTSRTDSPGVRLISTKRFVFILGAIVGLVAAWYSARSQELSFDEFSLDGFGELFEDIKGLRPFGVFNDAKHIEKSNVKLSESFAVGNALRSEGLHAKHPIVLVPGVISTGLESWGLEGTAECPSQGYFRKRIWGSWHMLRSMFLDKECWLKHIQLDPYTGLDPPKFKVRAAQGMDAADFFVTGYWIWNKIIENLAAIGYDLNNMNVASYDWRLSYPDLEKRDKYFSRLKLTLESLKEASGEKVVLAGHSMGAQVIFYFLKWVEAEGDTFGNGGTSWVEDHIEAFVNISGCLLGTPKAIVALLSGEMKDTVQLNAMAVYGLEKFFSRKERADMLRTFGGILSMLPKGGDRIWGSLDQAPDDDVDTEPAEPAEAAEHAPTNSREADSFGKFIRFISDDRKNLTITGALELLYEQSPKWLVDRAFRDYSTGLALTRTEVEDNNRDPSKWINPLEVALPNAPNMKIYCFYGTGNPTERSYHYQEVEDKNLVKLNVTIASHLSDAVVLGDGDGTIPLITHVMCHRWKESGSKFNPGQSEVKIVEMRHQPDNYDLRGGAQTAEHVDILGRTELNELVLRIAAGRGNEITERTYSKVRKWAERLDLGSN